MNLALRILSGAILVAVAAAALWIGTPGVATLVGAASVLAAWEFSGLAARHAGRPAAWLLYPLTLWLALRFTFPAAYSSADWPLIAAVAIGLLGSVLLRSTTARWATALAGAVFIGFSMGFYIALFRWHGVDPDHFGVRLVALVLLAVTAGDTFAYFVGSVAGRHRFFPAISPRKSIEGAAAGAAASIAVAVLAGPALVGIGAGFAAGLGALVALAAQGGDLVESGMKREAGVKDSSNLIPGHGGLLDRMDSLVLVGPVVYCYLKLIAF